MRRPVVTKLAIIAAFGLGGCETSATPKGEQMVGEQTAEDEAALDLEEHHRHQHLGGVTQFVALSLDTLGEDDAKRPAVEKLQRDLYECMAPARDIKNKLLLALAEDVAAGTVDTMKADTAVVQLNAAVAAQDCRVDALNELHGILSPIERAALVDKVEAHWEVWRHVNHDGEENSQKHGRRLGNLVRELDLTAEQVQRISNTLDTASSGHAVKFDRKEVDRFLQAFVSTFVAESFDAKSIVGDANALLASYGSTRMTLFYASVTPALTQEQRVKFSAYLREQANLQQAADPTEGGSP
ncbi:MAG: hypothetical protein A2289_10180 [Deltaproteobacteria bacterium RIFOXYA12_FULL_58_15]|nr:MAG: hypothetical protein A2289_10180 [Deltaproteobacteria bacterium RIFOXYA12_FULL_58_15]OGR15299.1 MAG: hypothetical protein A2341_09965 [Deltaproteobacteria bacterium RIFOXYB12_FULL_58_9]